MIAAEGEQKASRALKEASCIIAESPSALQLRYLQVELGKLLWTNDRNDVDVAWKIELTIFKVTSLICCAPKILFFNFTDLSLSTALTDIFL